MPKATHVLCSIGYLKTLLVLEELGKLARKQGNVEAFISVSDLSSYSVFSKPYLTYLISTTLAYR